MGVQTVNISGDELVEKVKEVVEEGNVRRVSLLHEGKRVIDIPLPMVGDPASPAAVLATPVIASIGAFGAVVPECTLEIERTE